eukprot:14900454-Ditylum_brightwellii.AAC.1
MMSQHHAAKHRNQSRTKTTRLRSVHTDVNTDIIATQQEGSRSQQKQQQSDNFDSSLLQLRCFTTPGCFPTMMCEAPPQIPLL